LDLGCAFLAGQSLEEDGRGELAFEREFAFDRVVSRERGFDVD
jgi:hypothetical protein